MKYLITLSALVFIFNACAFITDADLPSKSSDLQKTVELTVLKVSKTRANFIKFKLLDSDLFYECGYNSKNRSKIIRQAVTKLSDNQIAEDLISITSSSKLSPDGTLFRSGAIISLSGKVYLPEKSKELDGIVADLIGKADGCQ